MGAAHKVLDKAKKLTGNKQSFGKPESGSATGKANPGERGNDKNDTGNGQGRKNFLFVYAMTLMSIAFILVLLSYFSTIRANRSQIESLRQANEEYTISAMKNIQSLQDENKDLKAISEDLTQQIKLQAEKIDELEKAYARTIQENETLKEQNRLAADELNKLKSIVEVSAAANHINELYTNREYSEAAYEIYRLEGSNENLVREVLSQEENHGMFDSLIERYYKTRAQLEKKGYMDPEKIKNWYDENLASESDNH